MKPDYDAYLQQAYEEQADRYSHPEQEGKREYRIKSRGNGANDKDSILVTKNLLKTLHYLMPNIATIQRRGCLVGNEKKQHLTWDSAILQSRSNAELRQMYIDDMIGEMGVITMFDECIQLRDR